MAKSQQISVRFNLEDMERIKAQAKKENRPVANLITHLTLEYIDKASSGTYPRIRIWPLM